MKEKMFNRKLYAFVAFFAILGALIMLVTFTFKDRYIAFHPEEVARTYVDTIVQTGDGYNAYKNALIGQNKKLKYGDYIRVYYMYPVIYRDAGYTIDADRDELKGYNDESYMSETSKLDDGRLQGMVIDKMYPYFVELVENGWDDYDKIFKAYFDKLVEVRKVAFGDDYMTDEIMFTALEANVRTYGESLVGTEDVYDENTGLQTSVKTEGAYEKVFGEDCKFIVTVKDEADLDLEEYKKGIDANVFETYKLSADDISAVKSYVAEVKTEDGKTVAEIKVVVVKVADSWYVDNTITDTTSLYNFYK